MAEAAGANDLGWSATGTEPEASPMPCAAHEQRETWQVLLERSQDELFKRIDLRLDTLQACMLEQLVGRQSLGPIATIGGGGVRSEPAAVARSIIDRFAAGPSTRSDLNLAAVAQHHDRFSNISLNDGRSSARAAHMKPDRSSIEGDPGQRAHSTGPVVQHMTTRRWVQEKNGLQRAVDSGKFRTVFGILVIVEAILIGAQTDLAARSLSGGPAGRWLQYLGLVLNVCFFVELGARLAGEGWYFFTFAVDGLVWNYLDVLLNVIGLVDTIMTLITLLSPAGHGTTDVNHIRIIRILRLVRVVRIIRLAKILKFVRALRTMVHHIICTIKSLVWAMVLLTFIIYVWAIFMTQGYRLHLESLRDGDAFAAPSEDLQRYWSTMGRSMLTLFQAITGGINWDASMRSLADISELTVVMYIAYVCFAQLAVLNVLTGVFCQNAIESAAHDQELVAQAMLDNKALYTHRLREIFEEVDIDGSGEVTIEEFKEHLHNEKVQAYFESLELDTSDIRMLFKLMDSDQGGALEVEEFVGGCLRLKGHAKGVDMAKLSYSQDVLWKRLKKFMARTDLALEVLLMGSPQVELPLAPVASMDATGTGPDEPKAPEARDTIQLTPKGSAAGELASRPSESMSAFV